MIYLILLCVFFILYSKLNSGHKKIVKGVGVASILFPILLVIAFIVFVTSVSKKDISVPSSYEQHAYDPYEGL